METPLITSVQNPRVKQVVLLQQKSSERRKQGLFVVEGARELSHCLSHGYEADSLFVCDELLSSSSSLQAYRESTEGVLALLKSRVQSLERLELGPNPLIVVLESVEKPGNLGAILRSADASGADAVVVCDPLTDLYNPNLIRSSIGALFTVPCVACSSEDCIHFLKERGIQILTAQLQDSELYYDTPMTGPTAIVMGTESTGLTPQWRDAADRHIRIPMLGSLDSLNVSVSTAILLYEAVRQRRR